MSEGGPETLGLAKRFAEIARTLLAQESLQQTLDVMVDLATRVVGGCEEAGVMLLHGGSHVETHAASSHVVEQSNDEQTRLREGPCFEAIWENQTYRVDDFVRETRWPHYAPRAVELGIRSMLSFRLFSMDGTHGALDLYARKPDAFSEYAREVGWIFASHATVALAEARNSAQLRAAIETRGLIGQAVGILKERHRLTDEDAFQVLRRASNELNRKLRDVAEQVADTGELPPRRTNP